jgi:hypothetical protein
MTVKRQIAPVIRTSRLGEIDEQAERRAYWAGQPMGQLLGSRLFSPASDSLQCARTRG